MKVPRTVGPGAAPVKRFRAAARRCARRVCGAGCARFRGGSQPGRWEQASARTLSQRPGETRPRLPPKPAFRTCRGEARKRRGTALPGSVGPLRRRAPLPGRHVRQDAALPPQRPRDAFGEAAEVAAGRPLEQGGLDDQGEIAVEVAGRGEALRGCPCVVEAAAGPGVALAVAAARGALGLQRPAQGVALVPQGVAFAPEGILGGPGHKR